MMKGLRKIRPNGTAAPPHSEQETPAVALDEAPTNLDNDGRKLGGSLVGILQILGVLAATAAAVYFSREPAVPVTPSGMNAGAPIFVPQVSTISPAAGAQQILISSSGSVSVTAYVDLVPQISGRIQALAPAMRVGGAFQAGETLIAIEQDDFLLQVKQAQADVAVQRANLRLQQARSDAAVKNYALLNPGKSVPSLVALGPQIEQARAQLRAAEARADVARLALNRTQFALPFDGMITQSSAQVGQLITGGRAFGQAYALNSVELVVPIAPNELAQLAPAAGRRVVITTDHQTLEATIDRISAELDTRSRFAKAYIPLTQTAEAPTALQPGTFADVVIFGPNFPDSLVVPESALQANGAIWFVKEGELSQHQPQLLGRNDQGIVISRFDYADGIVVSPLATPSPGMTVNPVAKAALPAQNQR